MQQADPLFPALSYHLENVVLRTRILSYLDVSWPKLLRLPESFSINLPAGPFTAQDMDQAVAHALALVDSRRSTPNNWDSMLLAGLEATAGAKTHLAEVIRDVRNGVITPQQI